MLLSKRSKLTMAFVTASLPVMVFFQNCGQAGQLQVTDAASKATSAGLLIDTTNPNPQVTTQIAPGFEIPSDPVVQLPPTTMPPPKSPPVRLPPVSPPADPIAHLPPTISPPVQEPPTLSPPTVSPPGGGTAGNCDGLQISDMLLSVKSVNSGSACHEKKDQEFEVVDADKSISLNKLSLRVRATKNVSVRELFTGLNDDGNKVLTMQSVVFPLKTPSGQTSGLKVMLNKNVMLKAGHIYKLKVVIDTNNQLVGTKTKCILKPVIKSAQLEDEDGTSDDDDRDNDHHRSNDDDRDNDEHQEHGEHK